MILCAGLGTRLRPLTERWPKPALPILGAPLIRGRLEILHRAGVREVGINTHHLPQVMREVAAAECARLGMSLTAVHEPVLQGTGGGIRGLRDFLSQSDPFVVLNGDIAFEPSIEQLVTRHRESGADATMVLQALPAGEAFGAVEVDGAGRVRRIAGIGRGGEGLRPLHFTGVHVMSPRVFDFTGEGDEDIFRQVFQRLFAAGGHVQGVVVEGPWADLGTPGRYLAMVQQVVAGRWPPPSGCPVDAYERRGGAWIHRDARVDPSALIVGGSVIESGASVGPGARIEGSVILGGAEIAAGSRVEAAIVASGIRASAAAVDVRP